jgi:hypothetical protein
MTRILGSLFIKDYIIRVMEIIMGKTEIDSNIEFGHILDLIEIPEEMNKPISSVELTRDFLRSKNSEIPISEVSFDCKSELLKEFDA